MQVVIEIDEKLYNYIQTEEYDKHLDKRFDYQIRFAVKDGTPLPKGHGRLIDADELYGDFIDGTEGYDCQTWNRSEIGDVIEDAPTIIEADRSEEE